MQQEFDLHYSLKMMKIHSNDTSIYYKDLYRI